MAYFLPWLEYFLDLGAVDVSLFHFYQLFISPEGSGEGCFDVHLPCLDELKRNWNVYLHSLPLVTKKCKYQCIQIQTQFAFLREVGVGLRGLERGRFVEVVNLHLWTNPAYQLKSCTCSFDETCNTLLKIRKF